MLPLKDVTKLYKIKVYALAFNNTQDALAYPSLIDEVCQVSKHEMHLTFSGET
jgi:hypothetical protein